MANGKTESLKNVFKTTFYLRKNCVEKNQSKFSNQLGDTMHASRYFTNYRSCCSQVFFSTEESF